MRVRFQRSFEADVRRMIIEEAAWTPNSRPGMTKSKAQRLYLGVAATRALRPSPLLTRPGGEFARADAVGQALRPARRPFFPLDRHEFPKRRAERRLSERVDVDAVQHRLRESLADIV